MAIDTTTLLIVLISVGFVMSLLLAIVGHGVDRSLLIWSSGFACHALGFVLLILRGNIADILSIWLANILIASTYSFFALGLLNFLNQRAYSLMIWTPVAVMAIGFLLLMEQLSARIILGGMVNFVQVAVLILIIYAYREHMLGRGKYILATCFLIGVPVSLARPLAVALGYAEIATYDSPGAFQAFTFLSIAILNVVIALGFVLMQKEQAEAATDSIARSDELTGMPNRRRLYERIGKLMADKNSSGYGALILLDLDNFKALNDRYGHAAGDELLKQAAQRLTASVTSRDTVARLGGDEFVILLPDLGDDEDAAENKALVKAQTILSVLAEPYQLSVNDPAAGGAATINHSSGGTLGVKVFRQFNCNREELLRDADKAMYSAKNRQRGSIQLSERPSAAAP